MFIERNEMKQNLSRGDRFNIFSTKEHAWVREAVTKLNEQERLVILMRFWEENTIGEIAEILDLSWDEVDSQLTSALANLKREYMRNLSLCRSEQAQSRSKSVA